jgi:hypothetical protein
MIGLSAAVRAILEGGTPPVDGSTALGPGTGLVQVELRDSGRLLGAGWSNGPDYWEGLRQVLDPLRRQSGAAGANELMLCLGGRSRELSLADPATWRRLESNRWRGLFGYEIRQVGDPSRVVLVSPFDFVAGNRSFAQILENSVRAWGLTVEQARAGAITLAEFETRRFRLDLGRDDAPLVPLVRGDRLVALEEIGPAFVATLQRLLGEYLVRSVQPDGRMAYLYHPSRGAEGQGRNNAIRQWMATRSLIRVWRRDGSDERLGTVRRNLEYNLGTMYAEEGEAGLILDNGKVKLGAVALAALALSESPFAAEHASVRDRLATTVDRLWNPDGSFRTFYRPEGRNDCQNFYPGEALLFWASRLAESPDLALLQRFRRSFEYYRAWHLQDPNPAFIPWHTQAYGIVWRLTRRVELVEAVFAMNDWLLGVQQWESAPHPDCRGRFYDPKRPFGPPHASSTAVYLEGLADAFAIARAVGDHDRVRNYRTVLLRGLRSLAQLTFQEDGDLFYVSRRDALRGGVRTSESDNTVRVDNVQHALTAIDKVLDVFTEEDYVLR